MFIEAAICFVLIISSLRIFLSIDEANHQTGNTPKMSIITSKNGRESLGRSDGLYELLFVIL
jgi:hypothetical protein